MTYEERVHELMHKGLDRGDAQAAAAEDLEEENKAMREAAREVLDAMEPLRVRGVPLARLDSRLGTATNMLKTALAASGGEA